MHFLERVIEESPFPVQCIQTDRGREFLACSVQHRLREYGIRFRPIKPASPHLNGEVEPSQRTDPEEFYAIEDLHVADLDARLSDWQDRYNHFRPHGSLAGLTPWKKWRERAGVIPCWDEVEASHDSAVERIHHPDYRLDTQLRFLEKQSGKHFVRYGGSAPMAPRCSALGQDSYGGAGAYRSPPNPGLRTALGLRLRSALSSA
jgi:hypothetical protein